MAQRPDRSLPSASRWPLAVSILATVGILMTAAMVIFDLRREVSGRACENAENLLHVMAQDIARNIEILDISLRAVVDGVARPDVMAAEPGLRRMMLFDRSATATGLGAQVVFDEHGILTLDSLGVVPRVIAPVTDRDYFNAQREEDVGLFISQPYRSRLIGEDVIGLSRRISHPDGSFGGVALATIQLRYFDELLSSLKLGPGAVVSLVRLDGTMLVRHGPSGLAMPANVAGSPAFQHMRTVGSGTITATSRLDGMERQYNFRRVGRLPLILSVGLSTETLYAAWAREAVAVAATLAVICLAMIGLTARLTKELGRRAAAERALVEVNAELSRLSSTDALTELGGRRRQAGDRPVATAAPSTSRSPGRPGARRASARRSRSSSSTSITSRCSTTPTGTRRATRRSAPWPGSSAVRDAAPPTGPSVWAARSSPSSCPTPTSRARPPRRSSSASASASDPSRTPRRPPGS